MKPEEFFKIRKYFREDFRLFYEIVFLTTKCTIDQKAEDILTWDFNENGKTFSIKGFKLSESDIKKINELCVQFYGNRFEKLNIWQLNSPIIWYLFLKKGKTNFDKNLEEQLKILTI